MKYRLLVEIILSVQAISWQKKIWAYSCDFKGNDLLTERVLAWDCGPLWSFK